MSSPLSPADHSQLAALGISAAEAERQLALLARGEAWTTLERPCTRGDGIEVLDDATRERALAAHAHAASEGRAQWFVPASGAASRMFKELMQVQAERRPDSPAELDAQAASGKPEAKALRAFLDGLPRFAFREALAETLAQMTPGASLEAHARSGPFAPILAALLDARALDYANRPKGVLPFHREGAEIRTAFEAQLIEAGLVVRAASKRCCLHATVSPQHRTLFEALLAQVRARVEARIEAPLEVRFSSQHPATDTLAADADGQPFRDADGHLTLRPAGHGALIANLAECGADLVLIKNIDNVAHARVREPSLEWARVLLGLAAETESRVQELVRRLDASADAADEALAFVREVLNRPAVISGDAESRRRDARAALARPLRICGMVPNTGEPGGGPFWVRGRDGALSPQIVESAQVNMRVPAQRAAFEAGTHFNPVFLACGLRSATGQPYDLNAFVDPDAIILTRKSAGGRELRVLERPGLWNGAMAHWNTRFIEVPLEVFNPVKTVLDLLRPAHQPD
ncbi:MAG: DUF4301 family protein [Candidatus Eisenbacteria bacterium]|uniref:DUF4301 family protein n=1 Tax=Eiseniibacteriota bacterium TaxID=2212470 RepID=A0A849SKV1_UNCEI|nr:DUF4301 family protein [Candidatus Eisenbacteria bacterium]